MSGRRTEQHQYYMDFAPFLLYFVAVIMRQAKCLSACSLDTIQEVDKLLENLPTELYGCKLYTPTTNEYQQNCTKSILKCFEMETHVLITEISGKLKLYRMLKKLRMKLKDKKSPCPVCEFYTETEPKTFLEHLQGVLKMMNTRNECAGL